PPPSMSDGVRDRDITYGRLRTLKKENKTVTAVAAECLKLLGRIPQPGELKLCTTHISRALSVASETLEKIQRGRDKQDKSHFLNTYCGLATVWTSHQSTVALPPIPVDLPVSPPSKPSRVPALSKAAPVKCGRSVARSRLYKNLAAQLCRARRNLGPKELKSDSSIQTIVDNLNNRINTLTASNRTLSFLNKYLRNRVTAFSESSSRLKTDLRFSENARGEAEDSFCELQTRTVTLFDGVKYSSDTVVAVLDLLDCGVADEKVGRVMESVARLVGVKLDRVPCTSTIRNFAVASLTVAKAHAYERLDQAIERGEQLCLYSDETNKKNHTMAWLLSKSPEERQAVVSIARASISTIRAEETLAKKLLSEAILQ
ncbi:hypothetical protein PENTCL1PPCAC_14294, partial [Pristionchus entomophagus]